MAYNSSKGPQTHGDVKFEGDAEDTQIDFETDLVALKTNGQQRLIVSGSAITASVVLSSSAPISASEFYAGGVKLEVGMSSFTLAGDGGSSQAITNGNTVTIAGGTGLSSTAAATDTVTVNLDDTSVSAGAYTYSAITVDAQGRLTAASNGTAPSITTLNSAGANRVLTSDGGASATAESGLTYNGSTLSVTGDVTASLGVSGSSLRTGTTVIDTTHVSSSLNISGAAFYGDGSTLSNVGAGTMSSWTLSADGGANQSITDGNTVDIAGGTGITTAASATDTVTVNLDDTSVSAGAYTYSAITVDAQGRLTAASNGTAPSITTLNNAGSNRVLTSDGGATANAEAGLTYDGSILAATGEISASLGITGSSVETAATVINPTHVSSSLNISGSAFYVNTPGILEIHKSDGGNAQLKTNTVHLELRNKANNKNIRFQLGEDAGATLVQVRNNSGNTVASVDSQGDAVFRHITASLGVTGSSLHTNTTVIDATHVSSSLNVSASAFYARGVELLAPAVGAYTNAGNNRIITSVDGNTINGEVNLTYDSSTNVLAVTGSTSMSGSLTATEAIRGKQLYYTHHQFVGAANNSYFPFAGSTENTNANEQHTMVVPHDGRLVKILYRVENAQNTSFTLRLIKASNGVKEIDGGSAVEAEAMTATLPASDATTVTFTASGSAHYLAGDIIGIKNGTFTTGTGDISATCVWEYNQLIP